jgi:hypothetical protein
MRRSVTLLAGTYLLCWIPFSFAIELLGAWPSLGWRGPAAALELAVHAAVALACATAGWMLWTNAPAARGAATAAICAAAAVQIQSLFLTVLPHQYAPADRIPLALASGLLPAAWLAAAWRPRRTILSPPERFPGLRS